MAAKKTINNIWGELTTNRVDFTEEEIANGILYKGPVVSNQLNGLAYNLYDMVNFAQRTGGLYNSLKIYYENNIVSALTHRQGEAIKLEYFRCINTNPKGIVNTPPLIGGSYNEDASIPIFQGGATDLINWSRVDNTANANVNQSRDSFDLTKKIRLITLPEILQQSEATKKISAELTFVIIFTDPTTQANKTTTFTMKLKGRFAKDASGDVQVLPNRLGVPLPEICYEDVYSDVTDYGTVKDFHQMMPYGLRIEYGWEGSANAKQWGIYITLRTGIKRITINGSSDLCNVTLNNDSSQAKVEGGSASNENIVIPIRSNGGFEAWEQIGQIVPDCSSVESNAALQYQKGYFLLDASADEITSGVTKKLSYPEYGMYCRIKGINVGANVNPPPLAGMFMRNLGEHKIPAFSGGPTRRQPSSSQTDAMRRLTGEIGKGSDGCGLFEVRTGVFGASQDTTTKRFPGEARNFYGYIKATFDNSRQTPTTTYETRPYNVAEQFYLKAF